MSKQKLNLASSVLKVKASEDLNVDDDLGLIGGENKSIAELLYEQENNSNNQEDLEEETSEKDNG